MKKENKNEKIKTTREEENKTRASLAIFENTSEQFSLGGGYYLLWSFLPVADMSVSLKQIGSSCINILYFGYFVLSKFS